MHNRFRVASATVLTGVLLAGCGGGGPSSGGGKVTNNKIVLGVLTDLSGVYSDIAGKKSIEAVQMAVDDFKKKHGSNAVSSDIEVVSADHQNKPEVANTQARQMYERKGVDAIIDVPTSSAALAVADVAKQEKKIYLNTGAATTALTGANCNKYTFGWAYDTYMLANGTGTTVTKQGGKTWYIIYPDYAFGQDMQAKFSAAVKAAGGTVVASDPTPFPNDNFSTFLLKAPTLKPKPDVIGIMQAGGDLVNVAKQFNQFHLASKGIKPAVGLMFDNDIKSIGPSKLVGTMFTTAWFWNLDDRARAWADRFLTRTGERPNFDQAADYSAATHYLEAVQKAGTDNADTVSAALSGLKFDDFFARNAQIRSQDHRVVHDSYLVRVKNPAEASEPADYTTLVSTIPAQQAFEPPATDCHLN
ncbi:MAG TPA: ABC transporter substrate-binding protein [Mycobacteriales bacterium]|nr:ABC transporter substrate-binding protein [Mycobacteriales bacterium]